jgi:type IV pilus assembly protein PilO
MKPASQRSESKALGLGESVKALLAFDVADLNDLDALAEWPAPVRSFVLASLVLISLGLGYWLFLNPMLNTLAESAAQETLLRSELSMKANMAAELAITRKQGEELDKLFARLVQQLPSTSELPRLVDDITDIGLGSGLGFERLQLQDQAQRDFFFELPIDVELVGNYHDFGTFAGGVASLGRIVTLHDFEISIIDESKLGMTLVAKTYRYDSREMATDLQGAPDE